MQWLSIDLHHCCCSGRHKLHVDSPNEYDHHVGTGNQQHLAEHWQCIRIGHAVGACGEQLWTECSAHLGLKQESCNAIGDGGADQQLMWWRSVYLFGDRREWCHELCVDST